jgi:hypothetical protein
MLERSLKSSLLPLALAATVGAVACTADITGQGDPSGSSGAASAGAGTLGVAGSSGVAPLGAQPTAHLHKLTAAEFENSLHDLLGADAPVAAVEPDTESDGFASVGAAAVSISPAGVGTYESSVSGALDVALADVTRAASVLACVPAALGDAACLTRSLDAFGRRAFRRPLSAEESARYLGIAQAIEQEAKSPLVGLRYALSAILQSPHFLYRTELGQASAADGGRLKYTGFEMASRLAAELWNSVPDETLLDAAQSGALDGEAGVREQASRLLANSKARGAFVTFADDLYGIERLYRSIKDAVLFPAWSDRLRDSMHEELKRRLLDAVFDTPGDFLAQYDTSFTFVNDDLAQLYGLPLTGSNEFRRVDLGANSPRVGLLGAGALLAAYALPQRSSPTARGKFVAQTLLCRTVPSPPPGVDTTLATPMADPNATLRERLELHRSNAACAACHALMDPIGLGLEQFDGIGQYRETDHGKTIDASGQLDGVPFASAAELGRVLRNNPEVGKCFVRKLYTHAQGRTPVQNDEAVIDALVARFSAAQNRADQLLVELSSSEAFRFVEPQFNGVQ